MPEKCTEIGQNGLQRSKISQNVILRVFVWSLKGQYFPKSLRIWFKIESVQLEDILKRLKVEFHQYLSRLENDSTFTAVISSNGVPENVFFNLNIL